ncbi:hypothetical protein RCG24_16705 [Neobacillus sp. OS1-32]|uniref:hypothetical protein n=1 Tax=Neobacillus sp. OS1-32 TaxID=3070682 RepID=UPI0027E12786|nr:hypothetical protein [Neobacillus sp. OS1-32]WML29548.1 hypothetical protein RCG24_16705 [Neobacillus sp. OS1-32]
MKKQSLFQCSIMLFILFVSGCSTSKTDKMIADGKKVELTVSAAASLQAALTDIKAAFKINYGGSGALLNDFKEVRL